jgi:hypothetical protein
MKQKITISLIILFLVTNCGFEVVNLAGNFNITEIETTGNKAINFKLKNKLKFSSKNETTNSLKVNIQTKKDKVIKEKNINNKITKYEINITSKVEFVNLKSNFKNSFIVSKNGDYNVSSKYSDTLNNEKNLIDLLINDLSEEIIERLATGISDL